MWRRLAASFSVFLVAGVLVPPAGTAPVAAQPYVCDPLGTEPVVDADVPTAEQVLGFEFGEQEMTVDEAYAYLDAVDGASRRVTTGVFAHSQEGRPLRYAVVGRPRHVTERGLDRVSRRIQRLRDPELGDRRAGRIAGSTPAILWVAGNVHGDEESGTDASLRVLYELAAREDCAADRILGNALVVIVPTQNPDGRVADTRRNVYDFDLNRDWFARTQPETDGKIELLRRYPPQLFIDAHEMGRSDSYFFPPNPDPIYHEITQTSLDWINHRYGRALAGAFNRLDIPYFTTDVYDLFYMGYGDTVPTTGFTAAGMTFEKSAGDPIERRTFEQYVTMWVSLAQGSEHRASMLARWHETHVNAARQGEAGVLEPNEVYQPGNEVVNEVPDRPVRHYFVRDDDSAKTAEVQALVRRLQRMDIDVRRLVEPLEVGDFRAYGRPPADVTLPAGTYWVSMDQGQKHWIQAMLNEDTYVPFPYFYDVTAWSGPLLFNVGGGYSGEDLEPAAELVPVQPEPAAPALPENLPTVAVLQLSDDSSALQSSGWLRWLLTERWGMPYTDLTAQDIAAGGLEDVDVLLAPDGDAFDALRDLGPSGSQDLRAWVHAGGDYVGWRGGTVLAAVLGITTARLDDPTSDIPGSLLRVAVDADSAVAGGVGPFAWAFYEYDRVMTAPDPQDVVVQFPAAGSEDFFVSGFAQGEDELGGTAAVIAEAVGDGSTVVFSFDPNFRGYTDGTQKLLRNAILAGGEDGAGEPRASADLPRAAVRRAQAAARALSPLAAPIRLSVEPGSAAASQVLLDRLGASYEITRLDDKVMFQIANPNGQPLEHSRLGLELVTQLQAQRLDVVAFSGP